MRNDIKFAGLLSSWSCEYAKAYSDKLHEMGFSAKPLQLSNTYIVAYSYKSFNSDEAWLSLRDLQKTTEKRGND